MEHSHPKTQIYQGINLPHASTTTDTTHDQKRATTPVVNHPHEPDDSQDRLDHTKETRGQETSVGTGDAQAPEHGRAVVVDGVDAGPVLPHEEQAAEDEAPLHAPGLEGGKGLPETGADLAALLLEALVNVRDLLDDVLVVRLQVAHPGQDLDGLFALALFKQPPRRLGDVDGAEEEHAAGDELHRKGDQPLRVRRREGAVDAVVDPEPDQAADLPAELVYSDETTADGRR